MADNPDNNPDDLKPLLLQLIKTVNEIKQEHGSILAEHGKILAEHGKRFDQIDEQLRQVKEMVGIVRLREVARLDGRIDQLAQDIALDRHAATPRPS
ncbi:MAG: hypothetical protein WCF85_13905 [Rhodospirillaceae bacterium]